MKRRQFLLIQILLIIIATLMIPLNMIYVKFSEWVNREGEIFTKDYTIDDYVEWEEYLALLNESKSVEELDEDSIVYYTLDEEKSLAILTLKSCSYNAKYRECVKQMFQDVKAK